MDKTKNLLQELKNRSRQALVSYLSDEITLDEYVNMIMEIEKGYPEEMRFNVLKNKN